jgi:hypothetical protein
MKPHKTINAHTILCRICTLIYFEFTGIKVLMFKLKGLTQGTNETNKLQAHGLKSAILISAYILY